jgi:hypothetical protein
MHTYDAVCALRIAGLRTCALHKIRANAYLVINGTPQLLVGNTQMLTLMLDTFATLAQSATAGSKTSFGAADGAVVTIANLSGAR